MWSNFVCLQGFLLLGMLFIKGTCSYSLRSDYKWLYERDHCKELQEPCRGYPKCCGTLQCYFENGYGPTELEGICVPCVDRPLLCQRDDQCCDDLICHKDSATDFNGVCDILRQKGRYCHEDKQCVSGDCDLKWHRLSGVCE